MYKLCRSLKLYQSRKPPIIIFLPLPQLQLTFALASLFLRLFSICPFESHRLLFVFPSSARANRTVFYSSFLYLPVRLAPFIVRSLFVHCSFIVRSLFVHCSFIVRSLFVHCSFIVRSLFVLYSSFLYLPVRLAPSFIRLFLICPCGSHRLLFVFCSSFVRLSYKLLPN